MGPYKESLRFIWTIERGLSFSIDDLVVHVFLKPMAKNFVQICIFSVSVNQWRFTVV